MNFKDITVGIVSFKSEEVIFKCLESIKYIDNIIILDNSNDKKIKKKIKNIYPNIKIILSKKNLGYGVANNKIIKICKTKYFFLINPDTQFTKNCEIELLKSIKFLRNKFSIIAPISNDKNYGVLLKTKKEYKLNHLYEVDYVKGFALLINIEKIKNIGMFDENFFLYLEEIDLCKRLREKSQKIYILKSSKIHHIGAKSSNLSFEFEKCRNWHWMWSSVYFSKKYSNGFYALIKYFPLLILHTIKIFMYFVIFNFRKSKIYYYRASGLLNALLGNESWYRPKINLRN